MPRPTPRRDLSARLAIVNGAPWAFIAVMSAFVAVVIYTGWRGDVDWSAVAIAAAMLMPVIVAFIARDTVNSLLAENEELQRTSRSATARH